MNDIFCLMKFGKKEHLEKFINEGEIRFSPVRDFQSSKESERGDKFEGAYEINNCKIENITCNHPDLGVFHFKPVKNSISNITMYNDDNYNSFSALALNEALFEKNKNVKIDKKMLEFGDHILLIKNPNIFLTRIHKKLEELNLEYKSGLIVYKDFGKKGKIEADFFSKKKELSHQLEYRILIKSKNMNPLYINIGSIKEYSEILSSKRIIESEFKMEKKKID